MPDLLLLQCTQTRSKAGELYFQDRETWSLQFPYSFAGPGGGKSPELRERSVDAPAGDSATNKEIHRGVSEEERGAQRA